MGGGKEGGRIGGREGMCICDCTLYHTKYFHIFIHGSLIMQHVIVHASLHSLVPHQNINHLHILCIALNHTDSIH